jgi:hypothetical protein
VHHRDREHARLVGEVLHLHVAFDDHAAVRGAGEHRSLGVIGPRTDPVGLVDRLAGGRPDLADGEPPPVVGRQIEQQVGEAEIGQHPPLGHEPVEV